MRYDAYSVACNPNTTTVLGLQLLPASLGHILIFQRLGLPYFNESATAIEFQDFLVGTFVCSLTYEEFDTLVKQSPYKLFDKESIKTFFRAYFYSKRNGALSYNVNKWSRTLHKVLKSTKGFNLFEEIAKFNSYLDINQNKPFILPGDNASNKASDAPWVLSVITVLTGELGYSFKEAVNIPVGKALWEFFKYAESQGSVELCDIGKLEANNLITRIQ